MTITKKILRDAADRLWTGDPKDYTCNSETYMCHAVAPVRPDGGRGPLREEFHKLLSEHGVSTCGSLVYTRARGTRGDCTEMSTTQRQAVRFDFLNLLAESL